MAGQHLKNVSGAFPRDKLWRGQFPMLLFARFPSVVPKSQETGGFIIIIGILPSNRGKTRFTKIPFFLKQSDDPGGDDCILGGGGGRSKQYQ